MWHKGHLAKIPTREADFYLYMDRLWVYMGDFMGMPRNLLLYIGIRELLHLSDTREIVRIWKV
jgi:hypothetical protein